jgi:tetratricopeptide (TPR) repeat protein
LMAFAVYQPVRAKKDVREGLGIADTDPARALELGRHAHEIDPASADPMFLIAIAQNNLGDEEAAEATLVQVAIEQPGNLKTWQQLAQYRLNTLEDPKGAIAALRPLLYQSPNSLLGNSLLTTARERRTDQLIDQAADRERRRIERELERIEKLLEESTGVPTA